MKACGIAFCFFSIQLSTVEAIVFIFMHFPFVLFMFIVCSDKWSSPNNNQEIKRLERNCAKFYFLLLDIVFIVLARLHDCDNVSAWKENWHDLYVITQELEQCSFPTAICLMKCILNHTKTMENWLLNGFDIFWGMCSCFIFLSEPSHSCSTFWRSCLSSLRLCLFMNVGTDFFLL